MAEGDVVLPVAGMVISVRTRQDVIVVDPQRFLAAARSAYRAVHGGTEQQAHEAVTDVHDAAYALIERYGTLAGDHPNVAGGAAERPASHGGVGLLPTDRVTGRADGLSPAGTVGTIVLNGPTLQSYGCFLPADADLFGPNSGPGPEPR